MACSEQDHSQSPEVSDPWFRKKHNKHNAEKRHECKAPVDEIGMFPHTIHIKYTCDESSKLPVYSCGYTSYDSSHFGRR